MKKKNTSYEHTHTIYDLGYAKYNGDSEVPEYFKCNCGTPSVEYLFKTISQACSEPTSAVATLGSRRALS